MGFTTQLPAAQEYVYVIHATGTNRIKLGFSTKPQERLAQLQTASPFPLQMLACWPGSQERERRLHRHLAQFRQVGEWFEVSPFCGLKIYELVTKGEVTGRVNKAVALPVKAQQSKKQSVPSKSNRGRSLKDGSIARPEGYEIRDTSEGLRIFRSWREWVEEKGRRMMRRRYIGSVNPLIAEEVRAMGYAAQMEWVANFIKAKER